MKSEDNLNGNLNELEKHLYGQKKGVPRRRPTVLSQKKYNIPSDWSEKEVAKAGKIRVPTSLFKKFFFVAVIFFVAALGVSLFTFFSGGSIVSPANIEISVAATSFAVGGEKLPLLVEIKNGNRSALDLADLVVEYPRGGSLTETARIRESVGRIEAQSSVVRVIEPVLLGEEGTTKELTIRLEYRLANSNAIFVKEIKHSVVLSSSPILIAFEGPTTVVSDQDFIFNVKITSNATTILAGLGLRLRYPSGFVFSQSKPEATFGNNFFELGDLAPAATKSIEIRGRLIGGQNEARTFVIEIGDVDKMVAGKLSSVFATKIQTVLLTAPFVEARVLVGGVYASEYVAASQAEIPVQISWANNTNSAINNLEVRARLSGFYEESSVVVDDGFYDSLNDIVIFNQNTNPDFAVVPPGARGIMNFSLASPPLFQEGVLAVDPQIVIEVSVKGLQPTLGASAEVNNFERRIIRLSTEVSVLAKALHFTGPIVNSGPIPPRVDIETTYTIVWTITNSVNPVTRARISAVLPPYVRFIGNQVPASAAVSFNEGTREVTWRVDEIGRGVGLITSPKEVSFRVAFRPIVSQVDSRPNLLGETTLVGEDAFTKTIVSARRAGFNTELSGDGDFPSGGGTVSP